MTRQQQPTAIQKRADRQEILARFSWVHLRPRLPLRFLLDPDLPPSPKQRYRSHYRYLDAEGLQDAQSPETLSPFDVALRNVSSIVRQL